MGNFLKILHPVTAVIHWKVIDILSKYDIETVLDVGGVGKMGRLSGYEVIDANIVNPHCPGDGQDLPYVDNSFDAVVSVATLEHVDNQEKFVQECYRVAKKVTVHWFPCGMYAKEVEDLKKKYNHHHPCRIPTREEVNKMADMFKQSDQYNFIICGSHLLLCMTLSESLRVPEVYDYVLKFYYHNYGVILIGEK